jgi:hypothetical protein
MLRTAEPVPAGAWGAGKKPGKTSTGPAKQPISPKADAAAGEHSYWIHRMESALRMPFPGVSIRTDPGAVARARALHAYAWTDGTEVGFDAGAFAPHTRTGLRTLAHEFAHIAQFRGGKGGSLGSRAAPAGALVLTQAVVEDEVKTAAEADADQAAEAVLEGRTPEIAAVTLGIAAQEKVPTLPPRGSFRVSRIGASIVYVFNSQDVKSWADPELTVFTYFVQSTYGASAALAKEFRDQQLTESKDPSKLLFDFDIAKAAQTHNGVQITIQPKLQSKFEKWAESKNLKPGNPPLDTFQDLATGDFGKDDTSSGAGGSAKTKEPKLPGGSGSDTPFINEINRLYSYLLKNFPDTPSFSRYHALPVDLLEFVGSHPEVKRPPVPADKAAPKDTKPYEEYLTKWHDYLAKRAASSGQATGQKGQTGDFVQFEPSGKLVSTNVMDKYVKGSSLPYKVEFANTNQGNYFLNFFPRKATFDWSAWRGDTKVDSGGLLGGIGDIDYQFTPKQVGTYTVRVSVSSVYFKDHKTLDLELSGIVVVEEEQRSKESFNVLLADEKDPEAPFVRDDQGKLKVKPGQKPLTIQDEITRLDLRIGMVRGLRDQKKISEEAANTNIESLLEAKAELIKLKTVEDKPDFARYIARGNFVSRDTSGYIEVKTLLHRTRKANALPDLIYEIEAVDTTVDPVHPQFHPGTGVAKAKDGAPGDPAWGKAEKEAVNKMVDHWHSYNDFPDGTVRLGIQTLETKEVLEPKFDTHNIRKDIKTGLAIFTAAGGAILLAASPLTGGVTAPVGIIVLEAAVVAAGAAQIMMELQERAEKEKGLKADRRLAMDMLQLASLAFAAGGFTRFVRALGPVGKGMFLGTMVGLDIASAVVMATDVQENIRRTEHLYEVKIAQDPDHKAALQMELNSMIAQIIGSAAINGTFMIISVASGARQLVGAVGRASGRSYTVRSEIKELGNAGTASEIRTRLSSDREPLIPEERAYLDEALTKAPESKKIDQSAAPATPPAAPQPAAKPAETPKAPATPVSPEKPPATPEAPVSKPAESTQKSAKVLSEAPNAQELRAQRKKLVEALDAKVNEKKGIDDRVAAIQKELAQIEADRQAAVEKAQKAKSPEETKAWNAEAKRLIERRETLITEQGKLPSTGDLAAEIRSLERNVKTLDTALDRGALPCFSPDTLVLTPLGARRIDSLSKKDAVLAYDFQTGNACEKAISAVHRNRTEHFYGVALSGTTVNATGHHRFWVLSESAWIPAHRLCAGMMLQLPDGAPTPIESIELAEGITSDSYNLTIDGSPTYYVGPGVLVHNTGGDLGLGGPLLIYRGVNTKNPKFAGFVYIGRSDDIDREGEHQSLAKRKLKNPNLSPADRLFYEFMQDVELEVLVSGLNKDQAVFLEQYNIDAEKALVGESKVMNRRNEITTPARLKEITERIANDPAVQAKGYCPKP